MYKIIPVSVIDLKRPKKPRRTNQIKDNESSRAGFSPFSQEIATLCANFFLCEASLVFDPFGGWGERHQACLVEHLPYIGYDLSPDAIAYAKTNFGVNNILADSRTEEIPLHDALLTCPPYGNIEKYAGGGLTDIKEYADFLIQYDDILTRACDKALPNSTYCIIVGDWRSKGVYYNFSTDTEKIMERNGFKIHDKVILNQKGTANWRIMMVNAKRFKYTAKVHQYLLVFKR